MFNLCFKTTKVRPKGSLCSILLFFRKSCNFVPNKGGFNEAFQPHRSNKYFLLEKANRRTLNTTFVLNICGGVSFSSVDPLLLDL